MKDNFPSRRSVLQASGLVLAGLAGCSGAEGGGNDRQTQTPTDGDGTSGGNRDSANHSQDEDGSHHDDSGGHHDDSGGHGTSSLEGPTDSATVRMMSTESGHHFDPHVVWVETGGTVTWVNESGGHTATAYHPDNEVRPLRIPSGAEPWDSGVTDDEGATYERTFEVEGVYDYFCLPHENLGMIGSVIVGTPDFDGQQGMQPPQEGLSGTASAKIGDLNDAVENALRNSDE